MLSDCHSACSDIQQTAYSLFCWRVAIEWGSSLDASSSDTIEHTTFKYLWKLHYNITTDALLRHPVWREIIDHSPCISIKHKRPWKPWTQQTQVLHDWPTNRGHFSVWMYIEWMSTSLPLSLDDTELFDCPCRSSASLQSWLNNYLFPSRSILTAWPPYIKSC